MWVQSWLGLIDVEFFLEARNGLEIRACERKERSLTEKGPRNGRKRKENQLLLLYMNEFQEFLDPSILWIQREGLSALACVHIFMLALYDFSIQ